MKWEWLIPYIPWLGGLLSLGCLLASFRNFRRKSLTEGLPTSRALGVFMGLVEMKGAAECEKPLRSRITDAPCVHYEWSIEEQWEREERDSDGKTKTTSGWSNVGKGGASVPFYVKDATGAILVQPQGAEMDGAVVCNRSCSRDDPLYYGKGPPADIADSTGRRRFVEKAIRLHGPTYVVGKARERRDIVAAEIAADESAPLFLISGRSEKEVQSSFFWRGLGWTALPLSGRPAPGHMALKPALIAVQEKYPVLKAMKVFQQLQRDLVDTEERIALARDYYNNIATHFNTRIEQIPDRFVCLLTVMRRFELLSAQDFERAAVKVEFAR